MPLSHRQSQTGSSSGEADPQTPRDAAPGVTAPGDDAPAAAAPGERPPGARSRERTRTSVAFNSLLAGVIVLILLLLFILETTQSVKISYFGATGHISLGVALLLAAVGGALLVGLAGAARVLQLRHRLKHPRS